MKKTLSLYNTVVRLSWIAYLITFLLLSGCTASYPINPPLERNVVESGYDPRNILTKRVNNNDEVLLILSFSGGGTRAAAFSYGVLQELSRTYLPWRGQKLHMSDEVDMISSVSGGSFTAAYFGLFGDRIFEDFESRFLRRDLQGELTGKILLSPTDWARMTSSNYGRSDLATELYDETIFDRRTFADLAKAGGPLIVINATEMTLGIRFQFTQSYFNIICADLSKLPVARAVTASSAVPVLLSPVTLVNRAGTCGWQRPRWMEEALASTERTSRLYNLATNMDALSNSEERPYIHLLDGGLSDNLGLRNVLDGVLQYNEFKEALQELGLGNTRKIIVLLVNAETALDVESSRRQQIPTFSSVLNAATSVPLQRYSFETVALLKSRLKEWEEQSRESECVQERSTAQGKSTQPGEDVCKGITFDFIEINFSEHPDPEERQYLKTLPTSFTLPDEAIDKLIAAGGLILRRNTVIQQLLSE